MRTTPRRRHTDPFASRFLSGSSIESEGGGGKAQAYSTRLSRFKFSVLRDAIWSFGPLPTKPHSSIFSRRNESIPLGRNVWFFRAVMFVFSPHGFRSSLHRKRGDGGGHGKRGVVRLTRSSLISTFKCIAIATHSKTNRTRFVQWQLWYFIIGRQNSPLFLRYDAVTHCASRPPYYHRTCFVILRVHFSAV